MSALVGLVGLVACGSDDITAPQLDGYFAEDDGSAVFVQWTRHDEELTGVLNVAQLQGVHVDVNGVDFTGVVDEASVTLTLSQALGSSPVLSGSLEDGTLVLSGPSSGGLDTFQLQESTVEEFNTAVDRLWTLAAEQQDLRARAEAEAQTQAHRAVLSQRQAQLQAAQAEVLEDLADLRGKVGEVERLLAVVEDEADDEPMDGVGATDVELAATDVEVALGDAEVIAHDLRAAASRGEELASEIIDLARKVDQPSVLESAEATRSSLEDVVSDGEAALDMIEQMATEARQLATEARARASNSS